MDGLNRALQAENLSGYGGEAAGGAKATKGRRRIIKRKSTTGSDAGNELSGFSNLQANAGSRRQGVWAIKPLIKAVRKIGTVQNQQSVGLKRTLQKVSLDQKILLKEKLEAIWKDQSYQKTGPYDIKSDLRDKKQERHVMNALQREGYQQMLLYIKERDGHPLAEEK